MAKGTYTVSEENAPSSKDASYKSCLCLLLVFITICLIVFLVGTNWKREGTSRLGLKEYSNSATTTNSTAPTKTKQPQQSTTEKPPRYNTTEDGKATKNESSPASTTEYGEENTTPSSVITTANKKFSTRPTQPSSSTTGKTPSFSRTKYSDVTRNDSSLASTTEYGEDATTSFSVITDANQNYSTRPTKPSSSTTGQPPSYNKTKDSDATKNESSPAPTTEFGEESSTPSSVVTDANQNSSTEPTQPSSSTTGRPPSFNRTNDSDGIRNESSVASTTEYGEEDTTSFSVIAVVNQNFSTKPTQPSSSTNGKPPSNRTKDSDTTRHGSSPASTTEFGEENTTPLSVVTDANKNSSTKSTQPSSLTTDKPPSHNRTRDSDATRNESSPASTTEFGEENTTPLAVVTDANQKFSTRSTQPSSSTTRKPPSYNRTKDSDATRNESSPASTTEYGEEDTTSFSVITDALQNSSTKPTQPSSSTTGKPPSYKRTQFSDTTNNESSPVFTTEYDEENTTPLSVITNANQNLSSRPTQPSSSTTGNLSSYNSDAIKNESSLASTTEYGEEDTTSFSVITDAKQLTKLTQPSLSTTGKPLSYNRTKDSDATRNESSPSSTPEYGEENTTHLSVISDTNQNSSTKPTQPSSLTTGKPLSYNRIKDSDATRNKSSSASTTEYGEENTTPLSVITDANQNSSTKPTESSTTAEKLPKEDGKVTYYGYDTLPYEFASVSEPVCDSVECKSTTSRMLGFMNYSANPCNDFYEFACGQTPVTNTDLDTWNKLSNQLYLINERSPSYLKKFKTFYDSCVSHEHDFNYQKRLDGVLKLVEEVGELVTDETRNGTLDITDLFANLILRQSHPFMDVDIDIDNKTSKFILKLTLPRPTSVLKESGRWSALTEVQMRCLDEQRHNLQQLNLDLTKIYDSYRTCQQNHTIYLNSIETVVQALVFYSHPNNTFNKSQPMQDSKIISVLEILDDLFNFPPPSNVREAVLVKDYIVRNISDLQNRYQLLNWNKLFNKITGHTLNEKISIRVYFSSYFDNMFEKLQQVDDWKISNALMAIYAHNLHENLVIPQAKYTRKNYCIKLSSKLFHDVSANLYMKTWTENEIEESQKLTMDIFNVLKEKFTTALGEEEWLYGDSLKHVLANLKNMKLNFNKQYDSYNNELYLNRRYDDISLTTDYQGNTMKMLQKHRKMRNALIGEQYSSDYMWSYFVNAYDNVPTSLNSPSTTLIMVPLGMVMLSTGRFPKYTTYTTYRLTLSLAKEIGRRFDLIGLENEMALTDEAQHFYKTLKSIMENKSLFNVTRSVGHQRATFVVDPILSVNERIADNTAFKLTSDSLENFEDEDLLPWIGTEFSREKILHIMLAQEYCQKTDMPEFMLQLFESEILPASLRVENIMTNSKTFSEAFACPRDSVMNKNRRKVQFPHLEKEEH